MPRSISEIPEVADFLAHLRLKNLAPRTITEYRKVLRYLFDHVDRYQPSPTEITTADLRSYIAGLQERGLSAKTVCDRVLIIKRFFGFLALEGYIDEDPSLRLPRPKVGKRLPRALTVAQTRQLLKVLDDDTPIRHRDKVIIWLMYSAGLRLNEAVGIRVEDLDLQRGTLRVVGKGNRERLLYLKPALVRLIEGYLERVKPGEYLFPGRSGGHITDRNIQLRFKQVARDAGLSPEISPHSLRHSIAVHYLLEGAPITFVQQLLGHQDLATTGIYGRLVDSMTREIALSTKTALDVAPEDKALKERRPAYEVGFTEGESFVVQVLDWLSY
jgi:site-specific recombinase XerD